MDDARRYLCIDVKFPRPDRASASIRASQFLGFLAAHGQLDMASLGSHGLDDPAVDAAEVAAAHGADLACARGAANIRGHMRAHGTAYHSVVCAWCRSATGLLADARAAAPQACLVFDTVDANHLRLIRQARATGMGAHTGVPALARRQ
jgi:hypothetical protein